MITTTLLCPDCQSAHIVRYGHARNGKQRFRCRTCARTFRENPGSRAYSEERKAEVLATYQERASLRGLTRIFGVSRNTVTSWLRQQAEALSPLEETVALAEGDEVLELDELWSFVRHKGQVRWLWTRAVP